LINYLGEYPGVFDSEQIGLMTKALERAWKSLQGREAGYALGNDAEPTRLALAKYIIAAALGGESDPRRLSEGALAKLALTKKI
jgi:hypothetical protein